jgi:hypothetical protein
MSTFTKNKLSGATNGKQIKIVATATPGTTIHIATSSSSADVWDEIWIYASNNDTVSRTLTLEWGGTTSPDDVSTITLAPGTRVLVSDGRILQNSLIVKGFASAANVVCVDGFVNAIT